MNSFALLQDDVEDASDLAPSPPKAAAASVPEDRPADAVQDARAAREERKPVEANREVKEDKDKEKDKDADEGEKEKEAAPAQPKEKDLSFDEYQAQKAQLSSGLASLNLKGQRKANDGKNSGFENMSVLRKDTSASSDTSLVGVPVKEIHENKGLKDSTHAAVMKNAEIQSFFKPDPSSTERRPYNGPRRGSDSRRGDSRGGGFSSRGRGRGRGGHDGARGGRDQRGGYGRGADRYNNRGGYGRGNQTAPNDGPNGRHQSGRGFGNGPPKVPMAPNVDDTAAFPSL